MKKRDVFPRNILLRAAAEALVSSSSSQQSVEADEDYVVYKDDVNGNWDIYLYDLGSQGTTQVSSSPLADINPDISGNTLVWQSLVSDVWQIYSSDVSTGSSQIVSA